MTAASLTSLMHSSFLLRIGEGGEEGFCTDGIPSSPFLAMSNLAMVRDRFGRRKVIGKDYLEDWWREEKEGEGFGVLEEEEEEERYLERKMKRGEIPLGERVLPFSVSATTASCFGSFELRFWWQTSIIFFFFGGGRNTLDHSFHFPTYQLCIWLRTFSSSSYIFFRGMQTSDRCG